MPNARIETRHVAIARRARYAMLGDPSGAVAQVWFVLHGYGQLARRFARYFATLDDGARLIVAPEGLHRYYLDHAERKVGASWMTSEDRLTDIADYVGYLDRLYTRTFERIEREAVRVFALGFSQGVHTLCRWVAFGEAEIDRAVLWGATTPPDLDLDAHGYRLAAARPVLVVGAEDEYYGRDAVAAHEARLEAHGIPFTALSFAGGHRLDADILRTIADADAG